MAAWTYPVWDPHAIEEQTQRKFEDDYLVAKVEKLEAAVRELTEDEEDESSKVQCRGAGNHS